MRYLLKLVLYNQYSFFDVIIFNVMLSKIIKKVTLNIYFNIGHCRKDDRWIETMDSLPGCKIISCISRRSAQKTNCG